MPLNINYEGTEDERSVRKDRVKDFLAMSPTQVEAYMESMVVDIPSAREALGTLSMLLRVQAEEIAKLRK